SPQHWTGAAQPGPVGRQAPVPRERALHARRVGQTPAERLARGIAFTRRDLTLLTAGEMAALGDDLAQILTRVLPQAKPGGLVRRWFPPETVARLQEEIRAGLGALRAGGWPLRSPETLRLTPDPTTGVTRTGVTVPLTQPLTLAQHACADLLRACPSS